MLRPSKLPACATSLLALTLLGSDASAADTALLIGNKHYPTNPQVCGQELDGAPFDLVMMEMMLGISGWTVVSLADQTRDQILAAIQTHKPAAPSRYIVYFAGHGSTVLADQGALIGVDCQKVTPAAFQAAVGAAKDRTLVILDSCASGAFCLAVEDANHKPGFLTAVRENGCATKLIEGGAFTQTLVLRCGNVAGSTMTVQQLSGCLTTWYDLNTPRHRWNGSFGDWVLGSAPANGPVCAWNSAGVPCPCSNHGTGTNGCANSANANGASLTLQGQTGSSNDTAVLTASGMPAATSVLFLAGTIVLNGGGGIFLGDGKRCVGGSVARLATKHTQNGTASFPEMGDPALHTIALGITAMGKTRWYQGYYRDIDPNFCSPLKFNLTNAWVVTWGP